ncbi:MalM family protein [Aeromonas salmonicida]|uniref:MalM family protein n=1 Tax=Aeromonas salmonicida TaxID=645 RepID=UPI003D21CCF1
MKGTKQYLPFLVSLLVAGCANGGPKHPPRSAASTLQQQIQHAREQLSNKVVVEAFKDLSFQPLGQESLWVDVGADSQVYAFDSGKSYVMAFSLPALTQATHVKITIPVDYTVFLPSILLLDENHKAVQTIPSSTFSYDGRSLISGQNIQGEFTIPAPIGSVRVAYMVIYSTAQDMQGSTRLNPDDLQRAMQYDRTTDVARLINVEVPHSVTGRLYLTLDAEAAENATPMAKIISPVMVIPDKSLGELDYYQHIRTAVESKNYEQALAWVKAAEQAGFTKAREVFFAAQQ